MMLNKNQGSHLRATEVIVGWIELIKKAIVVKLIADNICKYGKIAYNWSKPSFVEYKNRVEVIFHLIAVELGFESPGVLMIIISFKTKGLASIFMLILGAISSKAPKRPNPLFKFSNNWLMAHSVPKHLITRNHHITKPTDYHEKVCVEKA